MEREKFLPIGTVVLLKEAEKKIMITGFLPTNTEGDKEETFDYTGCLYPEGIISLDEILLFNHDQVDKVFYLGYEEEEEKNFKKELQKIISIEESENQEQDLENTQEIKIDETEQKLENTQDLESKPEEKELNIFEKLRVERNEDQNNTEE